MMTRALQGVNRRGAPASATTRVPVEFLSKLRCPACQATLESTDDNLSCVGARCGRRYPVVDDIPVLIREENSLFAPQDFVRRRATFFKQRSRLARLADRLVPSIALNVGSSDHIAQFRDLLLERSQAPTVLVLGGSIVGQGMEAFLSDTRVRHFETDIAFGPRTQAIVDAHDIPLEDGSVDGVVVQAVLEHVLDPARCVAEIHRVLRSGGLVYAEVPFMQPVHGGAYDFTRYSHLGLRWLFRRFAEVDSGAVCGPGMALAYAGTYFLQSFGRPGIWRKILNRIGRSVLFPLKEFDRILANRPTALDAASALYFLGARSEIEIGRHELVRGYRGGL